MYAAGNESDRNQAQLRREQDAAARRERATILKRFLAQSADALLGSRQRDSRAGLCASCG